MLSKFDSVKWHYAPWIIFFLAAAVYLSTGHKLNSGDAIPSTLIPITATLHGTIRLDEFAPFLTEHWGHKLPYFVTQTPHGVVALYPVASGLLALPIVAIPILAIDWIRSPGPEQWFGYAHLLGFFAAAIMTAISAAIFWIVCFDLGFSFCLTLGLTLFYAFGSEAFCTNSQVLWQQGPGTLCILLAVLCLVRLQPAKEPAARYLAVFFSLTLATAVAVRPMNVALAIPLFLVALLQKPRLASYLILPAGIIGGMLLRYNLHFFGAILGGYSGNENTPSLSVAQFIASFSGLLFSPGRGLFLYFPISAISVILLAARPQLLWNPLPAALAASTVTTVVFYSFCPDWSAGWSVGPRYLTEIQPLILLLTGIVLASLTAVTRRRFGLVCFGILLPYSIFIQSVGTYSPAPLMWNQSHPSLNDLWFFRDNPIASAFVARN